MTEDDSTTLRLPTADDLRQWMAQRDRMKADEERMKARHAAEERALKTRIAKLDKLITAASALVEVESEPDEQPSQESPSPPVRKKVFVVKRRPKGKSWTATIRKIVTAADRGMTYSEVKDEIAKTHLGETLKHTEKSFYGGIGKLAERGQIIRHKGRLFSPKAFDLFMEDVKAGRVQDIPVNNPSHWSPNEIAVNRLLSQRPNGATTAEIVHSLLDDPPPDLAVTNNRNSIYNLLNRQARNGKLIKRGDRYYLPRDQSGSPGPSGPSESHSNGGGNGNPSSTGGGEGQFSKAAPGAIPAHPGV